MQRDNCCLLYRKGIVLKHKGEEYLFGWAEGMDKTSWRVVTFP